MADRKHFSASFAWSVPTAELGTGWSQFIIIVQWRSPATKPFLAVVQVSCFFFNNKHGILSCSLQSYYSEQPRTSSSAFSHWFSCLLLLSVRHHRKPAEKPTSACPSHYLKVGRCLQGLAGWQLSLIMDKWVLEVVSSCYKIVKTFPSQNALFFKSASLPSAFGGPTFSSLGAPCSGGGSPRPPSKMFRGFYSSLSQGPIYYPASQKTGFNAMAAKAQFSDRQEHFSVLFFIMFNARKARSRKVYNPV